ncbi:hypothetical protein [Listeria booriae]|uniref:hypothetical protein n=1 Tax=Listeria booriae TaxID=1552123 RepID=UPI00164E8D71|nr:hypothetical protein [Listeria booriae]MBC6301525.1 hypothetical protein [Listeria booriae]
MDLTLFIVRALSSILYQKDIEALFDKHAIEAYRIGKKSGYWKSKAINELPPSDEVRARKALGLVLLGQDDEIVLEELNEVFFKKLGRTLQLFIAGTESKDFYESHLKEMTRQLNALPQRVVDYVLLLLNGNGVSDAEVMAYSQLLLDYWETDVNIFSSLNQADKDKTIQLLKSFFPTRRFTNYNDFQKILYKHGLTEKDITPFQFFFASQGIATEEYANEIAIRRDDLLEIFALAVQKKVASSRIPIYVLAGIESLIVAKSYNKLRQMLLKSDIELVEIHEKTKQLEDANWKKEKQIMNQEMRQLKDRIKYLENDQREIINHEIKTREETIDILEDVLDKKIGEIKRLSALTDEQIEVDINIDLTKRKIALVGGYPKLISELGIDAYVTVDRLTKSLNNYEYVFLITSYASHVLKGKLDSLGIQYFYLASETKNTLIQEMKEVISKQNKEG